MMFRQSANLHSYASSQEILGYFKDIVAKHDMHKFVRLSHTVVGAWWNKRSGKWKIKIEPNANPEGAFYDEGEILINATGVLKYVDEPVIQCNIF